MQKVYVKPSSPDAVFLCLLSTDSICWNINMLFVSGYFLFAFAKLDSLSGSCYSRNVIMLLD